MKSLIFKVLITVLLVVLISLTIVLINRTSNKDSEELKSAKTTTAKIIKAWTSCQKKYLPISEDIIGNKFDLNKIKTAQKVCNESITNIENIIIPNDLKKDMRIALIELKSNLEDSCKYQETALISLEKTQGDYSYKNEDYKAYEENISYYYFYLNKLSIDVANITSETRLLIDE